jgi:hypothetical protein
VVGEDAEAGVVPLFQRAEAGGDVVGGGLRGRAGQDGGRAGGQEGAAGQFSGA